jgi:hypothetical protein
MEGTDGGGKGGWGEGKEGRERRRRVDGREVMDERDRWRRRRRV